MATNKTEQDRPTVQPPDDEIDFGDIPETDFSKGIRGRVYRDPYDPRLPDEPITRIVDRMVHYTPARRQPPELPDQEQEISRLRKALERIAALADAEQPLSVAAGRIAAQALGTPSRL